jgi:aconitate hydratase 2/2-methylisocitrate dehydratase
MKISHIFPGFPRVQSTVQVRAGGRIPLIIGRGLTNRAREAMSLGPTTTFKQMAQPEVNVKGFSLAQKMVGKAVGWMVEA